MIIKCENCGDLIEDKIGPLLNTPPPTERWTREAISLVTIAMTGLYDPQLTNEERIANASRHAEMLVKLMRDTRQDEV